MNALTNTCPLCHGAESTAITSVKTADIWSWLQEEWNARFSTEVIKAHSYSDSVRLCQCAQCGLEFWTPCTAGSTEFYDQLTSTAPAYYTSTKWEFDFVAKQLSTRDSVLDVACGSGAFVKAILDQVDHVVGIDTNPSAVSEARSSGAPVEEASVEEFARLHPNAFDAVSAFQVIEHLEDTVPFIRAAYACVKPGGRLFLSVPNRERRIRMRLESLDHPPHHLSRWSHSQLREIGGVLGAQVESLFYQPLTKPQLTSALRQQELEQLLPASIPQREFCIKVLSKILTLSPFYAYLQSHTQRHKRNLHGHTLLACYRKQDVRR